MEGFTTQLLSALISRIDLGIIVLDDSLRIRHWNAFIAERCSVDLAHATSLSLAEVFPQTQSAGFLQSIELARRQNRHVYNHWLEMPAPIPLQSPQEAERLAMQSTLLFPFHTDDGARYLALVVYDTKAVAQVNEQLRAALKALGSKQAEQDQLLRKLETANSQLLQSEKMAAIGQLAAGVAHEINNPIGYVFSNLKTLDGYVRDMLRIIDAVDNAASLDELRLLKRNLEYDYIRGDVAALINESEDGIDRVKRIISALKDFSHIDEDEFRPADLHRGLDTTLNVVNNELKYKAEVIKEYGELPEVECIASQINQVAMNLLVNAAHAIEQFGRITLRTGCDDHWAWIEVEDNGKGIEEKLRNRIFEPFFTTKPVGKGTGLGLALSYNIVQKHNGHIEVHSELGVGTRFRIRLPIRQPAPQPPQDGQTP